MAKYMVTGGCGFIGSQLTTRLIEAGHAVIIVDDLSNGQIIHPDAIFHQQNITHFDKIYDLFVGIDGCFHLAAKPAVNVELNQWFDFHATNLGGSLNVFKAAIMAGCVPVVYASSCAVYGDADQYPLAEDHDVRPFSAYGCDKLSTELNAAFLAHDHQLPSIGLRFFNVYGPHQKESSPYAGVLTHFITQLLHNKPLTIYGDGEQTRDFVFVDDVVENLMYAMQILKKDAHVVNICTGQQTSVHQLAHSLSAFLQVKSIHEYVPARASDMRRSYGSCKKMEAYGFHLDHDLKQGLKKTIDHFLSIL